MGWTPVTWGCGSFHWHTLRCLRESASAGLQEVLAAATKREVWGELACFGLERRGQTPARFHKECGVSPVRGRGRGP